MSQHSIIQRTKRAVAVSAGNAAGPAAAPTAGAKVSKASSSSKWHLIKFQMQPQTEMEWCWAAGAASIDRFFNQSSTMTQCAVANLVLGRNDCCASPASSNCDQCHSMTAVLTAINHLQQHLKQPLSFAAVKQEIDTGKPLAAHITWTVGGGHIPMIVGYRTLFEALAIADPHYGFSEVDYTVFKSSYQQLGVWDESYYLS